jgi:peptidyl-tRNA hydrolase, PTH1 family
MTIGARVDWLIVGLGNPGREYDGTRHNIGFVVANALAQRWGLANAKDRFHGRLAEGRVRTAAPGASLGLDAPVAEGGAPGVTESPRVSESLRVAVLCPQTYMNDAGRSVGPACGSFKLPLERVLVVHDEIDLPFGDVRTRLGGGLAGHNGLKSLKRELGGADFMRVRVGVGRPDSTDPDIVSAYVLGRFRESAAQVAQLVDSAVDHAERAVLGQEP